MRTLNANLKPIIAAWEWFPLVPPWLIVVIAVVLLAVLAYGSWLLRQKHLPTRSIVTLAILRIVMVAILCIGLFHPVIATTRTVPRTDELLVLVDASASMDQPGASGKGTRLDEVRQQLADSPAIKQAASDHSIHWFRFDRRADAIDPQSLQEVHPRGESTDFAASIGSALRLRRLESESGDARGTPRRVLLVSDGQNLGSASAAEVARQFGVSIDVVSPKPSETRSRSSDSSIIDVQAPRRVMLGSEAAFLVTLDLGMAEGKSAGQLELVLSEDGQELHREAVSTSAAGEPATRTMIHRPDEVGLKRYVFQLARGANTLGPAFAVHVKVDDSKHDVLVLEDTWRWEFKYLRRILEDDPSFSFTAFLSRGDRAFVQFGEPDRRVKLGGFPSTRRELSGFDTLILGDVRPGQWPKQLARNIRDAVSDDGISLVVVAGPHLGEWLNTPEIAQLLPVEIARESGTPVSGQIAVRATPEGISQGWFTLGSPKGAAQNASAPAPSAIPAIQQLYPSLRKRPAATVLLEAADQSNTYGPVPVVVEHTVGRGRVLFIATDTLWRWQSLGPRNDAGVTLHSAFWQHALRALAPPEAKSEAARLWIRPRRTRYRAGDRIEFTVERAGEGPRPETLEAIVELPDKRRLPLDLTRDSTSQGRFTAWFEAPAAGHYQLEVRGRAADESPVEASSQLEVADRIGELDAAPVDEASLARLAAATGGHVVDLSKADGWIDSASAESSQQAAATTTIRRSSDLWHNFTIVGLLCVCLAADWLLRLFRGYV